MGEILQMATFKDSKYADLDLTLNAIGKAVFANFYYDFKDKDYPKDQLAKKLAAENPKSRSEKQGFRIPRARHIFDTNQQLDALRIIIDSPRVDPIAKQKAMEILESELSSSLPFQIDVAAEQDFIEEIGTGPISTESYQYDNHPKKPKQSPVVLGRHYKRNREVALHALALANHKCEIDPQHQTFLRKNGMCGYTEPHHLVPLSASKDFPDIDLDREQNVVSLCSHCHNLLHYGADFEKELSTLFDLRKDLLESIGVKIAFNKLKEYYE